MAEERTEMTPGEGPTTGADPAAGTGAALPGTSGVHAAVGADHDNPDVIRAEIAQTRAEMSQTIDEISERLSPAHMMHQAKETVRDATVRRVRTMMDNPWPVALIGAGVAWMVYDRSRGASRYDYDDYTSDYVGRAEGSAFDDITDWDDEDLGTASGLGVSGMASGVRASGARVGSRLRDAGRKTMDVVSSAGSNVRTQWTTVRRRTSTGFDHMMRENPLAVGAAALAIGATIGLLVPRTQQENRLMGDARDSLVEMAQDAARRVGERVQETVAGNTEAT